MANLMDVSATSETELLSLEDILTSDDIKTRDVEIEEWGKNGKPGLVRIRAMTNEQLIKYGEMIEDKIHAREANLFLVMISAVDAQGNQLFTEKQLVNMRKKSAKAINTIAREALELNGVNMGAEVKRAKNA